MRIVRHTPSPPLDRLVRLWSCEAAELPDVLERVLPDGSMSIFVNLEEDEIRWYDSDDPSHCHGVRGATLGGARAHHFLIDTREQRSIVGATFAPGGARPFFPAPASALVGDHLPLDALWGRGAADLVDRLRGADTAAGRLRAFEAVLRERAAGSLERHPAVEVALACLAGRGRVTTVADVVDRVGMSADRFIRVFADHVGLTPKRYFRVERFQQAVRWLRRAEPRGLAHLALACGYYDQAHFIHDFRAFAGFTPTEYVRRQKGSDGVREHVPLA